MREGAHRAWIDMNGWRVLEEAIPRGEADEIAALMGVSEDTVHRWCRKPLSNEDHNATGRRNPIDYFLRLINALYARHPEGAEMVFDRVLHERAVLRKRHGRCALPTSTEMESALRRIGREADEMADAVAEPRRQKGAGDPL